MRLNVSWHLLLATLIGESSFAVDLIAHRGVVCAKQENSIEAIRTAWQAGADAVEIDLRVSADGIPYLFHDKKVGDRPIRSLRYSEIQSRVGDAAPTLDSVFELGPPPGDYILDIKDRNPAVGAAVAAAVDDWQFDQRRLIFQSDDVALLASLKERFSAARYYYLARIGKRIPLMRKPTALRLISRLSGSGIDGISLKGRSYLNANYVGLLKNSGYTVNVWTINDAARAGFYREIGVDGIITDRLFELRVRLNDDYSLDGECAPDELDAD